MTYQEPSQPASPEAGSESPASADVQPISGNALSGEGLAIIAVAGLGGSDSSFDADGNLVVQGQYGTLTIDAQGNYTFVPNAGTPEGMQDVFTYTLADGSTATLTIAVGGVADAAAGDVASPGNVINLPAGVDISDIIVSGNDLIISLPDGSQMTIPNGALFVPRLIAGDIEIPQSSIAALLIESEPDPETGSPPSSGGNFGLDAPPLDPGVPLGDLVPPTEPEVTPPEDEEVFPDVDAEPTILIFTPDVPAGAVNATASVDESGLPERDGEPEGTLEPQNLETVTGTIQFTAEDGLASITINGVVITAVGQQIVGANGILTITSIGDGVIGFSYTATDNTTDGVNDFEDFSVVVTDVDGDTATGTLHIDIADDEPIARDDTDTVGADEQTATGNVMTGAGTTSGAPGADTVGADNATLTAVSGADGSDATFDADGNLVVHGQYGTLTIDAQGNYTYVLDEGAPDNVQDVFVYTLTDGDGDTETATLTITVPDFNSPPVVTTSAVNVSEEGLAGGNPDNTGTPDTTNSSTASGNIGLSDPDSDATTVTLGIPAGSYESGGEAVNWVVSADGHTLIGYTGSDPNANHVIEVTIDNAGNYDVVLLAPFDDPNTSIEDSISFTIPVSVSDGTETVPTTILVTVEDDAVVATNDVDTLSEETLSATGNVITGVGTTNSGPDSYGADGPGSLIAVSGAGGSDSTFDAEGNLVVQGQYGTLTIDADGNYTYVLNEGAPDNVQDVFTYTLVDGDGDTDTATLTIIIPDLNSPPVVTTSAVNVSEEGLAGGNPDNTGTPDTTNSSTASGNIGLSDPDGDATTVTLGIPAGSYESGGEAVNWVVSADGHTLIGYTGSDPNANHVIEVTIDNAGNYDVVLLAPFDDPNTSIEDSISFTIPVSVSDGTETVPTTILVTVEDDAVVATNDVDTLSEETLTATGNVITGVGTTNSGPDSFGADGPGSLIAVSGAGGSDSTFDAEGNLVVQGQYGTLTIDADGNYTYVLNEGAPDNVQDVFTYTLVDGDGDTDTATLTIIIPDLNSPPIVTTSAVNVSEEGLESGIQDTAGTPDTTDSASASGNIGLSDPDGDATTVTLGIPTGSYESGGEEVNWFVSPDGHTLIGYTGSDPNANHVIEVTIDDAGNYDVVLLAPFDDPNTTIEDSISFTIPVTASDGTENASTTIVVTVEDDSPIIAPTLNGQATVTVDESGPADAASVSLGTYSAGDDGDVDGSGPIGTANSNLAGLVNAGVSFGADGEGSLEYSLVVNDEASGLTTTEGDPITLVLTEDGTIVGVVQGGDHDGEVAFAIGIDAETGEVTVDQYLTLDHPENPDPNDPLQLAEGSIGVVVTATDGDGDPVDNSEAPVDITGQITFLDDGPSVDPGVNEEATVLVDESGPGAAATLGLGTYSAGDDPDVDGAGPIAVGDSGSAVVDANAVFGADGEALDDIGYALVVTTAVSGLTTTAGDPINLVLTDDGTIVGIVDGGEFDGQVAFAIGIDPATGVVTVEQYLSLNNPDAGDPDDPVQLDNGTIGVVVTATDGDGDPISNEENPSDISGQLTFEDDGPVIESINNSEASVTVDESGPADAASVSLGTYSAGDDGDVDGSGPIGTANSNLAGLVNAGVSFGADGEGSLEYSLVVNDEASGLTTTEGDPITLVLTEDGTIVGVVQGGDHDGEVAFAIGIDAETGEVTVDQYLTLDHPENPDPNDPLQLAEGSIGVVVTATDGDGDPVDNSEAPVDITGQITFLDDGPSVDPGVNEEATVLVDESGPGAAATLGLGTYSAGDDPDVDGAGPIAVGDSGSAVVDANAVFGADGEALDDIGYALVVTTAVSGLTTTAGDPINLVLTDDGTIVGIVDGGEFDGQVAFAIGIDPATGVVTVEQYLSLNNPDAGDPDDPVQLDNGTIGVVVTATDGDGDPISNEENPSDISGQLTFEDDGPVIESINNSEASVTVDESGPADAASVALGGYTAADDGDVDGSGPIGTANSNAAALVAAVIDFGADGEGTFEYSLVVNDEASGLTTTEGDPITLVLTEDGTIVGVVQGGDHDGEVAFAIGIDAETGEVTVDQYLTLDHPDNLDPNDPLQLAEGSIGVVVSATDGDGDPVDNSEEPVDISGQITFLDDGPSSDGTLDEEATVSLDETGPGATADIGLGDYTAGDDEDVTGAGPIAKGATGTAVIDATTAFGADGELPDGSIAYGLTVANSESGLTTTEGEAIALVQLDDGTILGVVETGGEHGDEVAFAIQIDATTGVVTVEQYLSLNHPDSDDPNDTIQLDPSTISATVTVTDGDGDSITSDGVDISGQITFYDDAPSAFETEAVELDNDTGVVSGSLDFADDGDGDIETNYGADGGTVRFNEDLETTPTGLTSGGQPIVYVVSEDGLTLFGMVGEDEIFRIELDPSTSQYTVTMDGHVNSTSHVDFNNGDYDFVGGNDPWGGFTSADNDSQDLLITPMENGVSDGTFNSSSISGGVGDGNSVKTGEGIRLDFVIDLTGDTAKTGGSGDYGNAINQDHAFEDHYNTNGASADFTATSGSTVHVEAFDDPDGDDVVGDGVHDDITAIALSYNGLPGILITESGTYTVNEGTADEQTYVVTFNVDGTVDVEGVVGTSGAGAVATTIAVFTADGYSSVEFTNTDGDPFKIGNFGASVESTDPVNFTVPVEIVDGDGDVVAGTDLDITINPEGTTIPLTMMSSTQMVQSDSAEAGLVSSNDNEGFQRALATGSNAALMGAIAAVGLAETRGVHGEHLVAQGIGDSPMAEAQQIVAQALASHGHGQAEAGILLQQPGDSLSAPTVQNGGGRFQEVMEARGMDSHVRSDVARDMTQSTDAGTPAQEAAATTLTAASVAMPSADQMMDAPVSQVAPVQGSLTGTSDSVGKVLADALQGGDAQGPNLDALINALPDHGGGGSAALEALASHGGGAVPNGHMADFAGFAGGRNAAIIDEMEVHQDALPPNG